MNINEFIHTNQQEIPKFAVENPLDQRAEGASEIFDHIASECQGDKMLEDYFQKMIESCYNYTAIVCEFERVFQSEKDGELDPEEFRERFSEIDQRRGFVHNATIDSFNILSRLMTEKGKDNTWIKPLVNGGRIAYGNLAIKKTMADVLKIENLKNQEKGDNYGTDSKK